MSKAMQRALGVQLGLEDGDGSSEYTGSPEMLAENTAISEGAVEVADATDEVVNEVAATTALSEAASNLEEVSEAITIASENGTISKEAAVFMHLAIKNACGRFYGPAFAQAVPSVESFSGDSGRRRNTQIALEGIGQMLKSFWQAIVRQIKKMWAAIKNWYLRVLDQAPRLKKKAKALVDSAGDAHGTPEEKDFDMGSMHTLNLDGKAPPPAKAVELFGKLGDVASEVLGDKTKGHYESIGEDFEKLVEKIEEADVEKFRSDMDAASKTKASKSERSAAISAAKAANSGRNIPKEAYNKLIEELNDEASKKAVIACVDAFTKDYMAFSEHAVRTIKSIGGSKVTGSDANRFGDDIEYSLSDQLFGGSAIAVLSAKDAHGDLLKIARRSGLRMVTHAVKSKEIDSSGTFKTLGGGEIRRIGESVMDICDAIITYRKSWESRDKQQETIERVGDKAIDRIEKDKDVAPSKVRAVRETITGMTGFWQSGIQFDTAIINYLLKTASAALGWCERSLAQYK